MIKSEAVRKRLPSLFGDMLSKNISRARRVADAERSEREHAAEVTSPLLARSKSLPTLEPWQRELVPWAFGAVEYSERYGSMAREVRLWRLGCLVLLVGLGGLNIRQQTTISGLAQKVQETPQALPYVIEKCKGMVLGAGPATKSGEPDATDISASVAKWIRNLRTVAGDPSKQQALSQEVFSMVSPKTAASQKVKEWYAAHDPYVAAQNHRIEVEVFPPKFVGSATQLKVDWLERDTDTHSGAMKESHYSAFVTVAVSRSSTLKDRMANVLGIFVSDFSVESKLR